MEAMPFVLDILAHGAWDGGVPIGNDFYAGRGMAFKGGIPVTEQTVEERIGVRTRMAAPEDVRIGEIALADLLRNPAIDPARIRVLIAATNIGEDKFDPGPASRALLERIAPRRGDLLAFDVYAGCPGFNVAVEVLFHLALAGELSPGDLAVVVGAENVHRARAFKPLDTANLIFGDDAVATALAVGPAAGSAPPGRVVAEKTLAVTGGFIAEIARALLPWAREAHLDGILVDNQMGRIEWRVPATAARIQQALMEEIFPREAAAGEFRNFRTAFELYERHGGSFAFDVMSAAADPGVLRRLGCAYTASGRYRRLATVFLRPGEPARLSLVEAGGPAPPAPACGVVDTLTRTHGCFAGFIEARFDEEGVFGFLDGKGVFLYATRGAKPHLLALLSPWGLGLEDIDLLIEHQANFAMLPLTLEQLFADGRPSPADAVARYLAERMVVNIHERGNCSVVCMQRLPYDLERGALRPDTIQGFAVNRNLETLRGARSILYDSVGAGMTRSSFLYLRRPTAGIVGKRP
ncbi:MAG: hypothetical protein WHT06_09750 [Desulfobacterales bacterium]